MGIAHAHKFFFWYSTNGTETDLGTSQIQEKPTEQKLRTSETGRSLQIRYVSIILVKTGQPKLVVYKGWICPNLENISRSYTVKWKPIAVAIQVKTLNDYTY